MSPLLAEKLIRSRRTIHSFGRESPPRELILRAIDLARWAPNHRLTAPWRFYLLGPATADAICRLNAELTSQAKGAQAGQAKLRRWREIPGWLVLTCKNSDDPIRAREDYAACCCALQNMCLYLWSEGIGFKWNTGAVTRASGFFDLISVNPALETVVALVWFGYPAEIPSTARKPASESLIDLP